MSDEENNNEPPEEAEEVSSEPSEPVEKMLPQSEVSALIAKEVAKAKRRMKRDLKAEMAEQKTEPTASAEQDSEVLAEIRAQRAEMAELKEALAAKEADSAYQAAVAGMELSDHDSAMLRALHASSPEVFEAEVKRRKAADSPPEKKGPGFVGTGAAPNPHADPTKKAPSQWTKDDVAAMRANGTFLERLNAYRDSLPGGSGGLFPAKRPKKVG